MASPLLGHLGICSISFIISPIVFMIYDIRGVAALYKATNTWLIIFLSYFGYFLLSSLR